MGEKAVNTQEIGEIGHGRFRALLCGDSRVRAAYDHLLLQTHECVVGPTLGSIVPNWLLVVPRRPAVNFREWHTSSCIDPVRLIGEVLDELGTSRQRAIWFEHGPCAEGSIVGCGVDHAHIHILIDAPFSFDELAAAATESARLAWRRSRASEAYGSMPADASYLVAGSLSEAVLAEKVESAGSQFFRRIVAQLVGKPNEWNYRTHAHLENVRETLSTFTSKRALAAAL